MVDVNLPVPFEQEEAQLLWLFEEILDLIGTLKCFANSPSFFIVYAHNNSNNEYRGHPALENVVVEMIGWFEKAKCNVQSDKQSGITITDKQLCILPYWEKKVDYVILCGSRLLGKYMETIGFSQFVEDVAKDYAEIQDEGTLHENLRPWIGKIQPELHDTLGKDFHHVLTEIGFIKARESRGGKATTIILRLNGTVEESLPDFLRTGNNYLRTSLGDGPDADGSKYSCFLEILAKLGEHRTSQTGTSDLVNDIRNIYNTAVISLAKNGKVQENDLKKNLYARFFDWIKAQPLLSEIPASVIKLGLASFASSLSIETLSDETIPIDRYRLKLQVVESSGLETAPKGNKKEIISTTQILDERTLRRGNEGKPNRILIRGRPGTGKSTLGRQILHQMEQKPWNQFQWVLWVPLDRFTREIDLTTFLGKVYFKERYDIAGGLLQRIFEGQDNTLLILDGWDEINGTSPDIMGQVQQLAQFKNVIFTSRPRFPEMSRIDLILDISGFDDYTISSYVEDHAIGNSGTVPSDIKSFLSKNKTVKETFRGPLLLDLLCSFWHTLKLDLPKDPEQGNPPTLTMLYQTMVTELWRKSMSNFIKPPYTREEALLLSRFYLNKEIEPESHCLSAMAMQLFERRETTMNRNDIDEIAERDDQKGKHKWLAPNVTRTSFLHNDEFNIGARYSFLHQTFQEFFAAQSLVGNLSTLGSYIQKYKYDPRFTMVFRFVAGLLQKSGRETQLEDFFTSVEAKPRDLLGPAHERLVMNCLMEIQPPYIAKIRKCFEDRMKDWLLFECRWTRSPQLVTDPSFPDHVRKAVLEDATVHQNDKIFILHAFDNKASISPAIQGLMDSWLEGNKIPPALQAALLQTYDGFPLSKKTLLAIQRLSEDKSPGHEALSFVANLVMVESEPPQTGDLENLLRRKGNTHEKHAAIAALRGPSRLSEETIDILLVHGLPLWGDPLIRETMLNVLYKQANLDHGTWEFIWRRENQRRLEDQVSNSNPSFSQGELEQLDRDLHDDDPETIFRAVHTLRKQSHLPSQIIFRLAELVDGDAPIVSATAAHVLEQMSSFSAMPQNVSLSSKTGMMMALDRSVLLKTLEILVRCLSREDGAVRCCAGRILVQQTFLPNKILVSIKDSLMSGDNDIKPYAALILVLQRAHLQPWMTEAVICQVETMEGSELVRLEQRVDLPDYIVRPIVSRLEDRRGYQYQFNAIRVLGRQQKLDSNALQAIAAKVNDKLFNYFKEAVASAIKQHIETAITAALMEESSYFFKNIYQVALVISLQEPLSWSFDDDQKFCENMIPNDSISAVRMHHFIGQASKALKMPKPL